MSRRWLLSLLLIPVVLVGAGLMFNLLAATKPEPEERQAVDNAFVVQTQTVAPQRVVQTLDGFGTARASRAAEITAQVAGEVVFVADALEEGVAVRAGEVLLRIDPRDYEQQVAQARAQVDTIKAELARLDVSEANVAKLLEIALREEQIAERDYERVLGLFESGNAPLRERDLARTALESARRTVRQLENEQALFAPRRAEARARLTNAQAAAKLAQLQLERTTIAAPFNGQIDTVSIEVGERVGIGAALFALLDPRLIEIPIELPASFRALVAPGAATTLQLSSDTNQQWDGTVARIAPRADERNRTFALYVEVDNTAQAAPLLPGMFVSAAIDGPVLDDALLIPRAAIQRGAVFVSKGDAAARRPITVERTIRDQAVVTGLAPGDELILTNLDRLFDGAAITSGASSPPTMAGSEPELLETGGAPQAQAEPVRGS